MAECLKQLPSVERVVVLPYVAEKPDVSALPKAVRLEDFIAAPSGAGEIAFARMPFNHPLFIMYSSGTTGAPKCIVHGAGGTLLQHLKEHQLHSDIRPGDRQFYFTTCGWMMWNWLVTGLASGATLLLYDGSPFHPDGNAVFDFIQDERCTLLRHLGQVHRRLRQGGAEADRDPRPLLGPDHRLDRLAAAPGKLRLRLRRHQA